uniref:DNA-damage-inducible protein J n=1 Tax=Bartonella schoenbuchensis TaxID=165694 RepID=A0A024LT48_9HYPH|nr:hypothetical protein BN1046_01231 [Bartonella schoenbuchensis]
MTRIAQDKAIPSVLFQPNAKTLEAFVELDKGGLKKFNSVNELFDDLYADD